MSYTNCVYYHFLVRIYGTYCYGLVYVKCVRYTRIIYSERAPMWEASKKLTGISRLLVFGRPLAFGLAAFIHKTSCGVAFVKSGTEPYEWLV